MRSKNTEEGMKVKNLHLPHAFDHLDNAVIQAGAYEPLKHQAPEGSQNEE